MPKKLIKTTYFITCTGDDIHHLQQGTKVQRLAVRDELDDGTIEEIWVEIEPVISITRHMKAKYELKRCVLQRYHEGTCSIVLNPGQEPPKDRCIYSTPIKIL